MPRFPLYMASQQLPERMPGAQADPHAWAAPAGPIIKAGVEIGRIGQELARDAIARDVQDRRNKQALDAMQAVTSATQIFEDRFLEEQRSPDWATLDARVEQQAETLKQGVLKEIADPETKLVVNQQLTTYLGHKILRAKELRSARQQDAGRAQVLDALHVNGDFLANATKDEMPRALGMVGGVVAGARSLHLFTDQELVKLHADTLDTAFAVRAERMIRENPWQALADLKGGAFELTPTQREQLTGKAERAVEQREGELVRAQDQAERREKEARTLRQDDLAGILRERAYAGEDIQALINERRRDLGDQHHRELLSLNRTLQQASPAKERKSDDLTVIRLQRDIQLGLRTVRDISKDIDAAIRREDLVRADAVTLLKDLGGEQRRQESEGDQQRKWEISRGLDALKKLLTAAGMMDFDAASDRLTALAELEYSQKVRANRTADPLAIAHEVGMKYQQGLSDRAVADPDVFGRVLGKYQTAEQVLADYQAGKLTLPEADAKLRLLGAKIAAQQSQQGQPPAPSTRQPKPRGK